MDSWKRVALASLSAVALIACGSRDPVFEVMGIKLDSATLESARKIHPDLKCDRSSILIPDYVTCRVHDVDVAKIRSSLTVEANKAGVITAITLHGEPYDGPFGTWSKAMTEKYGSAAAEEPGSRAMWNGANGQAILTKTKNGGAMLWFQGKRWDQDLQTLKGNAAKGQKF